MKASSLANTDQARFVNGLPAPITPEDWRRYHLQSFPAFANPQAKAAAEAVLQEAIETVYTMWVGIPSLWEHHDPQVWFDKTRLCYRLLVCWYIADMYPLYSAGILSTAGMPITRRKIGPVDLTFHDSAVENSSKDLLSPLLSNPFGAKAHMMIKSSYRRLRITNGKTFL